MITANQLIVHAIGDYILQSDWMANQKTSRHLPCAVHAISYTLVFLLLTQSILALLAICITHFVIDRWRLARYICWAKNWLAPPAPVPGLYKGNLPPEGGVIEIIGWPTPVTSWRYANKPWSACSKTGYDPARPDFHSVWLLIITDNILHILINAAAIRWL